MGTVIGPFDTDDWFTLSSLKKDLAFAEKNVKGNPEYKEAERAIRRKWKKHVNKVAA